MFRRTFGREAVLAFSLVLTAAAPVWALTDLGVSFEIENRNESLVVCAADAQTYTISGRLVAPDTAPQNVTLALHGLGFGDWFWGLPGKDFAADLAGAGHAIVTVDRLGYDESGKPHGFATCLGAQATIARQIADQLRAGTYSRDDDGTPITFTGIAIAGHSLGGAVAQIAAYSFPESFDALAVVAYADQGASDRALSAFGNAAIDCATGGTGPDGPAPAGGYARFGRTDEDFVALMFHDADAGVVATATSMRNPDPCGDDASVVTEIVTSNLRLGSITAPVLVLCAGEDAIFPRGACEPQIGHFTGSSDRTLETVDGIGHAVTLENGSGTVRARLSAWLAGRGF